MAGNVDADFLHDGDSLGMDISRRLGTGASDIEQIARSLTEDSFGKVTPAGISRAEN